ncbi:hypothetical protein [Clostridium transplantifaecale]|uniref:hypothetical protein n=1 Tax=Clostridium transplantifaecale TaxID=2479838 RepID=UPI000F62F599|nr:hypothetical protein [Clostridium transplantifaecale]
MELVPKEPDAIALMERFGAGQQADLTFQIIKAENVLTVPVSRWCRTERMWLSRIRTIPGSGTAAE